MTKTEQQRKAIRWLAGLSVGSCIDCPIYYLGNNGRNWWRKCHIKTNFREGCVDLVSKFALRRAKGFITVKKFLEESK